MLFLSHNKLLGPGGKRLANALAQNEILQALDISFNSVCNDGNQRFPSRDQSLSPERKSAKNDDLTLVMDKTLYAKTGYADAWRNMFSKNQSLVHVDLSYNMIKQEDCAVLAQGLKNNHRILGLHFQGNLGYIDALGHLHEGIPFELGE